MQTGRQTIFQLEIPTKEVLPFCQLYHCDIINFKEAMHDLSLLLLPTHSQDNWQIYDSCVSKHENDQEFLWRRWIYRWIIILSPITVIQNFHDLRHDDKITISKTSIVFFTALCQKYPLSVIPNILACTFPYLTKQEPCHRYLILSQKSFSLQNTYSLQ